MRERARRGRLGSTILFFIIVIGVVLGIPAAVLSGSPSYLPILVVGIIVTLIAVAFNHAGLVGVAGFLIVTMIDLGFSAMLLTTSSGAGNVSANLGIVLTGIGLLYLLLEAQMVAVCFFPPASIILVALVNSVLIVVDALLVPPDSALGQVLRSQQGAPLLLSPIALHILVAAIAFLFANNVVQAIQRADRAEEIAAMEHAIAQQKQDLDAGIAEILRTHVYFANGGFDARANVSQGNALWAMAQSLNNLLARLQSAARAQAEMGRITAEIGRLSESIREAKAGRSPNWPSLSGSPLDQLVQELVPQQQQRSGLPPGMGRPGMPSSQPMGQPYSNTQYPGQGQGRMPGMHTPGIHTSGSAGSMGMPSPWGEPSVPEGQRTVEGGEFDPNSGRYPGSQQW